MNSFSKSFVVEAPSNIAFIKYWGKHGRQLPMNPSISMTLSKCITKMSFGVQFSEDINSVEPISELIFEGEENSFFKDKMNKYLENVKDIYPFSDNLNIKIRSENSFPHSAGIASSASSMAALAYGLGVIKSEIDSSELDISYISELARLASGSASRSVYSRYANWGYHPHLNTGYDKYAHAFKDYHSEFLEVCDSVLIVSSSEKAVSSSVGHSLMQGHPYREGRLSQALENYRNLTNAMREGDWEFFGEILENEALSLHALMMSSSPSFILLCPASLSVISEVQNFRKETKLPLYFTIDAGPNIHLIYPSKIKNKVIDFINTSLTQYSSNVIHDEIGMGVKLYE